MSPRLKWKLFKLEDHHKFIHELNLFLGQYAITTDCTDVFENTILQLAQINLNVGNKSFCNDRDGMVIRFHFTHMNDNDARALANFFENFCGPVEVRCSNGYHFILNLNDVRNHLFPLFKSQFLTINKDKIQLYQEQTASNPDSLSKATAILLENLIDKLIKLNPQLPQVRVYLDELVSIMKTTLGEKGLQSHTVNPTKTDKEQFFTKYRFFKSMHERDTQLDAVAKPLELYSKILNR